MRRRQPAADHLRESGHRLSRTRLALTTRTPFELPLVLFGHGWIDLAPHRFDATRDRFETVVDAGGPAHDVAVTARGELLTVTGSAARAAAGAKPVRAALRRAVRRILRLDHDYSELWSLCAKEPHLAWVARRGGGRLLASATLFEDLLKLLFTTNCSWSATRLMVERLVEALGTRAPSGRAAFPSATVCASANGAFWREVVRVGYRERSARKLAERFATGELDAVHFEEAALPTATVRDRLLALDGFGPYAAGQALRLLGRHDDLALDSWCRARFAKLFGAPGRKPPGDRAIARRYAPFQTQQGLVLWLELTAGWHGEGPREAHVDLAATLAAAAR